MNLFVISCIIFQGMALAYVTVRYKERIKYLENLNNNQAEKLKSIRTAFRRADYIAYEDWWEEYYQVP